MAIYYVDVEDGSNANNGLSAAAAVKNVDTLNGTVSSGDGVLFKRGQKHTLDAGPFLPASAVLVLGAYGDSDLPKPVLDGGTELRFAQITSTTTGIFGDLTFTGGTSESLLLDGTSFGVTCNDVDFIGGVIGLKLVGTGAITMNRGKILNNSSHGVNVTAAEIFNGVDTVIRGNTGSGVKVDSGAGSTNLTGCYVLENAIGVDLANTAANNKILRSVVAANLSHQIVHDSASGTGETNIIRSVIGANDTLTSSDIGLVRSKGFADVRMVFCSIFNLGSLLLSYCAEVDGLNANFDAHGNIFYCPDVANKTFWKGINSGVVTYSDRNVYSQRIINASNWANVTGAGDIVLGLWTGSGLDVNSAADQIIAPKTQIDLLANNFKDWSRMVVGETIGNAFVPNTSVTWGSGAAAPLTEFPDAQYDIEAVKLPDDENLSAGVRQLGSRPQDSKVMASLNDGALGETLFIQKYRKFIITQPSTTPSLTHVAPADETISSSAGTPAGENEFIGYPAADNEFIVEFKEAVAGVQVRNFSGGALVYTVRGYDTHDPAVNNGSLGVVIKGR